MTTSESNSSSLKMSMCSVTSNPISDQDMFLSEIKKYFKIITISMLIDWILNELTILNDYIILYYTFDDVEGQSPEIFLFCLFTLISIIIYGTILYLLNLKILLLTKIIRFCYIIIGILYYLYQIIYKLIELNDIDYSMDPFNVISFVIISLSIVPKITGYMFIKAYEKSIQKIDAAKRETEQQHFLDKIEGKFIRSTNNSIRENEYEKELDKNLEDDEENAFIDKNKNKNNKKNNIKENENENNKEIKEEENKEQEGEKKEQEEEEVAD